MIYMCKEFSENCAEDFCKGLPEKRRRKAKSYIKESDKCLCGLSYCLFQYGMKQCYQIKYCRDWKTDRKGKPYLEEYPQIAFNISHCKACVVCGFSGCNIGIDVQDYDSMTFEIADYLWNLKDKRQLLKKTDWKKSLCILWCMKEAYVKCIGAGIGDEIFKNCFSDLIHKKFREGYLVYDGYYFSIFDLETHCMVVCANEIIKKEKIQEVRVNYDKSGEWNFLAVETGREKKG